MPHGTDWTIHPGEHWLEAIEERRAKQVDVAAALGCSPSFLNNVLRGHRMPSLELTIKFGRWMHPDDADSAERAARLLWRIAGDYMFDRATGRIVA